MKNWARGSLLVVALGAMSNLALTFIPDVMPHQVTIPIIWCTAVATVVIAVVYLFEQTIAARQRVEREAELERARLLNELRQYRGIEWVSADREHRNASLDIWKTARRQVVVFGFGMTSVARDPNLIWAMVNRGVDVDVIKVDPEWLVNHPAIAATIDGYYDRNEAFIGQVLQAHDRLEELARQINAAGRGQLTIHTYRTTVQYSGSIRDPGTSGASGYVEFHLYRKSIERLGIGLTQYDGDDDLNPPILQHVLHSLALAVGHPVPAERRPPPLRVGDEGLALGEESD
ncbi:hypothetical protein [Promicromonospora soli]|uniref:Uncharacterized protein n=1 Tax=Promicromonospora soli TaxID=2035533 RepID=A0A919KN84_9MICO|nr:hypothetical protein [Promicromonospora soli]GHH65119.1 hypothetical protein GCM10017772_02780 [Promicromonospora soli]